MLILVLAGPKSASINRTRRSDEESASFPHHQFSLRDEQSIHFCSATLIQPLLLLTAAHCILGKSLTGMKAVSGGQGFNVAGAEESLAIDKIIIHPNFDVHTLANDIALLQLRPGLHEHRRNNVVAKLPQPTWALPGEQAPPQTMRPCFPSSFIVRMSL